MAGVATKAWDQAIEAEKAKGLDHTAAVKAVDKKNPGLRTQMLKEANARRPVALRGLA